MNEKILQKYAELLVKSGVNVKKGQLVVVRSSVNAAPLTRAVVKEAYLAGAGQVKVNWGDETVSRLRFLNSSIESLSELPEYKIEESLDNINKGCCFINIIDSDPDALVGIPSEKIKAPQVAMYKHPKFPTIMNYSMSNLGQWTVAAYPSSAWAKKVFPNDTEKNAYNKLEKAILSASRVTPRNNPIKEWNKHNYHMHKNARMMNNYNFKSLHYTNSLGTDLTIELPNNHLFIGGSEKAGNGQVFNANIPTEEVFSAPKKDGVNGKVVATKPLVYNGVVIDKFYLEFKNGKIVNYDAEQNLDVLKQLIETDEGSHYLGEVALVPFDSPINNSNILFYNTLFDENASCHLAIGRGYPMCVKGGTKMSPEELEEVGINASNTHNDFMIGSSDLNIVGVTHDGKEVIVFKNGNFLFEEK